jgi:hypothetical protein
MHKAGSASTQNALFRWLSDARFYFIDLGLANCSPSLATAFLRNPTEYQSNARLGKGRDRVLGEKADIPHRVPQQLSMG